MTGLGGLGVLVSMVSGPSMTAPWESQSVAVVAVGTASIALGVVLWIQQVRTNATWTEIGRSGTSSPNRVGHRIDDALTSSSADSDQYSSRVVPRLKSTLDRLLVDHRDLSRAEAAELRRSGRWTDDPRAATFLGRADVRSRHMRLRDWLYGDAFAQNLRATILEIDRLATGPEHPGPEIGRENSMQSTSGDDEWGVDAWDERTDSIPAHEPAPRPTATDPSTGATDRDETSLTDVEVTQ